MVVQSIALKTPRLAKSAELCRSDIGRTHGSAPTIGTCTFNYGYLQSWFVEPTDNNQPDANVCATMR